MRLGVLDIGSNTGHLLVVDAHGGAAPLPAYSYKEPLRLAEHLVPDGPDEGAVSEAGIDALVFDTHTSILEGSLGVLPRRIMVADDAYEAACRLLRDAGEEPYEP